MATAQENGPLINGSVAGNDYDIDTGDSLSFAITGIPPACLLLNSDGSYSYDPTADVANATLAQAATRTVSADYTVTDTSGATATSTLSITITGMNAAPTDAVQGTLISEDSVYNGTLPAATDADGNFDRYELVSPPAHGGLAITDSSTGACNPPLKLNNSSESPRVSWGPFRLSQAAMAWLACCS